MPSILPSSQRLVSGITDHVWSFGWKWASIRKIATCYGSSTLMALHIHIVVYCPMLLLQQVLPDPIPAICKALPIFCCLGWKTIQIGLVGMLKNDDNSHVITCYLRQFHCVTYDWMVLRSLFTCTLSHATDYFHTHICMRNRLHHFCIMFAKFWVGQARAT